MILYVLPGLFALFVWWLSTGIIMYLDGLPRRTFKWSLLGATIMFGVSLAGLAVTRDRLTLGAAYWAFTFGLLAWGWQEISFYMGYVTGPRRAPCEENCRGWRHFGHAIQTSLWHELAIIASAIGVVALTWHGKNQIGTWTFMVLWWMHQSAKLNVFLGVRNLNEEFLPEHLQFLRSFLTKKSMNLLFPVSITVSTVILVYLVQAAGAAHATRFDRAGFSFLSTMMGLAILEHWLLMLPLPAAALWGWSLRSRPTNTPVAVEIVAGFLGAGKTTLLRARMADGVAPRTVVLVNDFAASGIDGSLLAGAGAEIVELPNGCICCTLKGDLAKQLGSVIDRFSPERVLIEPSGVADLASLLAVLSGPALAARLGARAVTTVVDGGAFLADWARRPEALEASIRLADEIVVTKADLVSPAELAVVIDTASARNGRATIGAARYGVPVPPPAAVRGAPVPVAQARHVDAKHGHAHDDHTHDDHAHHGPAHHDHAHHEHGHDGHAHHHEDGHGLASWSGTLGASCSADLLADLLPRITSGAFGEVERLKGLARVGEGWLRFDIAGGRVSMTAFSPAAPETPRVVAIGRDLHERLLQDAFDACTPTLAEAA